MNGAHPMIRKILRDARDAAGEPNAQWTLHAMMYTVIIRLHTIIDGIDAGNRYENFIGDRVRKRLHEPAADGMLPDDQAPQH